MAEKAVKNTVKEKPTRSGRTKSYEKRQNRLGYAFMAPWIAGFLLFTLFPFGATIVLSFCNVSTNVKSRT